MCKGSNAFKRQFRTFRTSTIVDFLNRFRVLSFRFRTEITEFRRGNWSNGQRKSGMMSVEDTDRGDERRSTAENREPTNGACTDWLAWFDQLQLRAAHVRPLVEGSTRELRTVVRADQLGKASELPDPSRILATARPEIPWSTVMSIASFVKLSAIVRHLTLGTALSPSKIRFRRALFHIRYSTRCSGRRLQDSGSGSLWTSR